MEIGQPPSVSFKPGNDRRAWRRILGVAGLPGPRIHALRHSPLHVKFGKGVNPKIRVPELPRMREWTLRYPFSTSCPASKRWRQKRSTLSAPYRMLRRCENRVINPAHTRLASGSTIGGPLSCAEAGGRYWTRTSDLLGVNEAL